VKTIRVPARVTDIAPAQFDLLNARAAELLAEGHEIISLGQALPGFGPPSAAIEAARRALDSAEAHVYSADAGRLTLREALCARLASRDAAPDARLDPDEVIITAGGNQAFMLAVMTLVDPGDEVLLPAPYFVNHQMAVAALGAVPVEVPLHEEQGFALRWKDLEPRVSGRTRAVVVCTPSNPTGAVVPSRELARIARELAARDVVLISDETYSRFVFDGGFESAAALPGWRENVVVVNTFSKSFGMTGWRVGYMLADRRVCEQAIKIQDAMIICAPVISQAGVEAAIRDAWDYPLGFARELGMRRAAMAAGLRGIAQLHWQPTGGGFFAFVRVEGCTDSARLSADLLERAHLVTIPGSTFGRCGEGFVRLSFSAVSCDEIAQACTRLRRHFG
jgi:aspartate/methionine/tyrosine aminotransferase